MPRQPKKSAQTPPKRGQPEKVIDLKQLEKLCALGLTDDQLAVFFDVSTRTIELRKRRPEFKRAMDRGKLNVQISLRQKQIAEAMDGNTTMLVWLGKNLLGQRDKPAE